MDKIWTNKIKIKLEKRRESKLSTQLLLTSVQKTKSVTIRLQGDRISFDNKASWKSYGMKNELEQRINFSSVFRTNI